MNFSLYNPTTLVMIYLLSEFIVLHYKRKDDYEVDQDQGSKHFLIFVTLASLGIGRVAKLVFPQGHLELLATLSTFGIGIFFAGICLRWVSIIHLGRFFTTEVMIVDEHKLINTGPYRFVRHPSYSGLLLALFGIGICSSNLLVLGVIVLPTTMAFLYRIRIEEAVLAEAFGTQYQVYAENTKRLVPCVY